MSYDVVTMTPSSTAANVHAAMRIAQGLLSSGQIQWWSLSTVNAGVIVMGAWPSTSAFVTSTGLTYANYKTGLVNQFPANYTSNITSRTVANVATDLPVLVNYVHPVGSTSD